MPKTLPLFVPTTQRPYSIATRLPPQSEFILGEFKDA